MGAASRSLQGGSWVRSVDGLLYEQGKVDAHLDGYGQLQVGRVGEGVGEGIHRARHHLIQHPPSPRHSPSSMCPRLGLLVPSQSVCRSRHVMWDC